MGNDGVNIVLWGIGNHANNNLIPAIYSSKRCNLYGCLTRNKDKLNQISEDYKCMFWENYQDMLDDPNIDAVFLSTPPALHYNQGMKILESGKHLFCEKPLTSNLESTIKLLRYAEKNNLAVCEGLMYQYHPQFSELRDLLFSNEVINIKTISSSFGIPKLSEPGYRTRKELGASCLFDVGIYPVSLIQSFFGNENIEIISVKKILNEHNEFDISGTAHLMINSSINCFIDWGYNVSYRNEIDIWAENISLYSDRIFSKNKEYTPSIEIRDSNGKASIRKIQAENHFNLMIEYFVEVIGNQEKIKDIHASTLDLSKLLNDINKKLL